MKVVVEEDDGAAGRRWLGGVRLLNQAGKVWPAKEGRGRFLWMPRKWWRSQRRLGGMRDARLARGAKRLPRRLSRLMWAKIFALRGVPLALVVIVQELVLELGHVDVGGAFALAALAFEAEVQGFVEAAGR